MSETQFKYRPHVIRSDLHYANFNTRDILFLSVRYVLFLDLNLFPKNVLSQANSLNDLHIHSEAVMWRKLTP
jgi:hypothetical protein